MALSEKAAALAKKLAAGMKCPDCGEKMAPCPKCKEAVCADCADGKCPECGAEMK